MRSETLVYLAFGIIFLVCTVVFLGFVLAAWLGWILGLLWMAAATPFMVFLLWRLYSYSFLPSSNARHNGQPQ